MASRLHQLEISYDPIEDRLLLKFHTDQLEEFRLWITRRFAKMFWATIKNLLATSEQPSIEKKKEAKKVVKAYEREKSMKKSDFVQKYTTSQVQIATTPLGSEPILVSRIQIKRGEDGSPILCMHPEQGQGFEISAHTMILQALSKLLSEAVLKTDWDLKFDFVE